MKTNELKIKELYKIAESIAPRLPYHNLDHMKQVSEACEKYALMEKIDKRHIPTLKTAGLLHDIVYVPGRKNNEEKSVEIARKVLPEISYSSEEVENVSRLILATKVPTSPKDILEKIICDSDVDNFGRNDFFEKTELLRQEFGVDKKTWYTETTPNIMNHIRYYTESAKKLREVKLKENIEKLRRLR
jgi:predicted metal-dependent HD superfamily phosphohydrolase